MVKLEIYLNKHNLGVSDNYVSFDKRSDITISPEYGL